MARSRSTVPALVHHRPSGRARVRIDGRDIYLGTFGSAEADEKYRRLVAEYLLNKGRNPVPTEPGALPLSVSGLILRYLEFAMGYYRKDGRPTSEIAAIRSAMRVLREHYGLTPVPEFGPLRLKAVREAMVSLGWARTTVNDGISRIRRVFKWGVENELVPAGVFQSLVAVSGLRKGRCDAREPDPVRPVDESVVNATLPHVPRVVSAMIRLQLLSGCRPGEIVILRPCDVRGEGDVWEYIPSTHKTQHHGQARRIYFGPRAQAILAEYLDDRPADSFCFCPAESEQARRVALSRSADSRPTSEWPRKRKAGRRLPGARYTSESYRRAITRACELAFEMPEDLQRPRKAARGGSEAEGPAVLRRLRQQATAWRQEHCWHPNQLRHAQATMIRRQYGIEGAQTVLGHANLPTTEIYAEADFERARRIMAEIG